MKRIFLASAAMVSIAALATPAAAQRAGDKIENSYICVFKAREVSRGQAQAEANRAAQSVGARVNHVYSVAIRGFSADLPPQAVERLKANNPNIDYCEQDQIVTHGPIQAAAAPQVGIQSTQETPWGIARVGGGAASTAGFGTAWVIDSGIDLTHPDLRVDRTRSRSFIRDSSPQDQNGHGTHVAGTIAALDNTIGVIGVAPGAPVVAVRVLDRRGSGSNSGVIAGVDFVAANGRPGDVANMSLGGGISTALDTAVVNAAAGGVVFALAAGNESTNAINSSPGRANGPNVYTVSAFSNGDRWASFSNFGNPPIDYAEPGVAIKSTWLNGGYNTISGTSMATPHLAGLVLQKSIRSGGTVSGDPAAPADTIGIR
jgi:subtilisin family serine protease